MTQVRLLLLFILSAAFIALLAQNTDPIDVHFLFFTFSFPLTVLVGCSLLLGFIWGLFIALSMLRAPKQKKTTPAQASLDHQS